MSKWSDFFFYNRNVSQLANSGRLLFRPLQIGWNTFNDWSHMEHPLVRICVADVFFFLFCFLCQWGGKVWPFRWLYGRHFPSGGRNPHNGICRIGITKFLLNGWFSLGILNSCSGLISNILAPFLGFLMFFFSFLLGLLRDSFENCQWFVSGPPTSSKIVANWLTVLKQSLLFIN